MKHSQHKVFSLFVFFGIFLSLLAFITACSEKASFHPFSGILKKPSFKVKGEFSEGGVEALGKEEAKDFAVEYRAEVPSKEKVTDLTVEHKAEVPSKEKAKEFAVEHAKEDKAEVPSKEEIKDEKVQPEKLDGGSPEERIAESSVKEVEEIRPEGSGEQRQDGAEVIPEKKEPRREPIPFIDGGVPEPKSIDLALCSSSCSLAPTCKQIQSDCVQSFSYCDSMGQCSNVSVRVKVKGVKCRQSKICSPNKCNSGTDCLSACRDFSGGCISLTSQCLSQQCSLMSVSFVFGSKCLKSKCQ